MALKIGKDEADLRRGVVAACRSLSELGLNRGTSGNVSVRHGKNMLISPTGIPYDELKSADVARMSLDSTDYVWEGKLTPSSEWRFHHDILNARPDMQAVVHTHSTYATVLAIAGREIPAVHYMIAAAGGPSIKVGRYATYGTKDLSDNALRALEGRNCCLLANHGMIAVGPNLKRAVWLAMQVETLAQQYYLSLQIGGPNLLSDDEIERVRQKFASYGPRAKTTGGKR
jgi:L-fuculose-phosphate aldolase